MEKKQKSVAILAVAKMEWVLAINKIGTRQSQLSKPRTIEFDLNYQPIYFVFFMQW